MVESHHAYEEGLHHFHSTMTELESLDALLRAVHHIQESVEHDIVFIEVDPDVWEDYEYELRLMGEDITSNPDDGIKFRGIEVVLSTECEYWDIKVGHRR